ncbi:ribose-phosphate pyrophosphokinase [Candidatus Uhrbacteria bacterium]|nr:ribose-phosphate pyrophosphokinase [Candidatus Uhrbacteria bacterium]
MKPSIIGLSNDARLVRGTARVFGAAAQIVRPKKYAAGEWTVFTPARIGTDVIVVGNVWEDPVKNFQLFLLIHAAQEAGARNVSLIAPWIAYGRQDRPAHPGEIAAGHVIADLLLATGVRRIVTLDTHSHRFETFFRDRLDNIRPTNAIVRFARSRRITAIAAPDHGAADRAQEVARKLRLPLVQVGKKRLGPGRVTSHLVSGDPNGARVLLVDDMADTGDTLLNAAAVLRKAGAVSVHAYVSHAFDLARLRKTMKRGGLASLNAAFDHATGVLMVPYALFARAVRR